MKLILKLWLSQSAHGLSAPRVANCLGLNQKMCVVKMVARVCFITCAKQNGKFINITWTTLKVTHRIVFMIQVERSDVFTIILMVTWQ